MPCPLYFCFFAFCILPTTSTLIKWEGSTRKKKRRNEMRLNNLCRAVKRNSGILNQEEGCKENKVNNSIRSYNEMTLTASSFCFSLNNCWDLLDNILQNMQFDVYYLNYLLLSILFVSYFHPLWLFSCSRLGTLNFINSYELHVYRPTATFDKLLNKRSN